MTLPTRLCLQNIPRDLKQTEGNAEIILTHNKIHSVFSTDGHIYYLQSRNKHMASTLFSALSKLKLFPFFSVIPNRLCEHFSSSRFVLF
jgi:hypothetical protein